MQINFIGAVKAPTGETRTVEDPELGTFEVPVMADVDGYFAIANFTNAELSPYVIEGNPYGSFAGGESYTYNLVDEETAQPFIDKYTDEYFAKIQNLKTLVAKRYKEIEAQAKTLLEQPVVVDGVTYRGGQDSGTSIRDAIDMIEQLGGTTIDIRDASREARTFSLAEGRVIAASIGIAYNTGWQAEETALRKLETMDLDRDYDTVVDDINSVKIEL